MGVIVSFYNFKPKVTKDDENNGSCHLADVLILACAFKLSKLRTQTEMYHNRYPRGVLVISSDRDDQRIFFGLKFSIPGFFGVRKFWQVFYGWLDLSRDFLEY